MVGAVNDLVGQYDKLREAGSTAFATKLSSYLTKNHGGDNNPWNPSAKAYPANSVTSALSTYDTASAFSATLTAPASNGVLYFKLAVPSGAHPGFKGGAVKVQNMLNGSYTVRKVTAVE
jgi:hypothetical protein